MTPDNQRPDHQHDADGLPEERDKAAGSPTPEEEDEAMEEAQKEGAEQRKEGGYQ